MSGPNTEASFPEKAIEAEELRMFAFGNEDAQQAAARRLVRSHHCGEQHRRGPEADDGAGIGPHTVAMASPTMVMAIVFFPPIMSFTYPIGSTTRRRGRSSS